MSDPAAGGDGPLRVFISSTPADLQEQREAIREAVLGLDHHPDDMIYWSADERSGATHSVARVRRSDVLILVVAHRYGHVPTHGLHSVTELEYRAAHAAHIPVLAFFLNPAVAWPPTHVEWEAREKLAEFKALVETQVTKKTFHTTDELARQVVQALALLTARQQATPPVRRRFRGPARTTSLPAPLTTEPDVLIPIGTADLLLDVRRSRDLSGPLATLAAAVSPGYGSFLAVSPADGLTYSVGYGCGSPGVITRPAGCVR